jgi:hypothetical protein
MPKFCVRIPEQSIEVDDATDADDAREQAFFDADADVEEMEDDEEDDDEEDEDGSSSVDGLLSRQRTDLMEALGGVFGALEFRDLDDGRGLWVYPQIYTVKLVIGPVDKPWYDDHWCYKDAATALTAFREWNPAEQKEPDGWVRHPPTGRRRFPDGDPETEYVAL